MKGISIFIMPITIRNKTFNTKSALEAYAKAIRNNEDLYRPVNDTAKEFITELFKTQYNGVGLKFSSPVKSVCIILRMGGRCFQFALQDGTTIEPSLKYCFQSKPDNTAIAKKCFRDLTWPFCLAYRTKYFNGRDMAPCELTGRMTTEKNCEIDHVHPDTFEKLLSDFLSSRNLKIDEVEVQKAEPKWLLKDASLGRAWVVFHDYHAVLRVLDTAAHVEHTKALQMAA